MKKITYIMVALAGLTFIACNKEKDALPEEETTPAVEEFTYTIAVDADTKAYLDDDHMTWQSEDQIGWFTDKAGSSEINMSADPRNFEVSSTAAMAAGAKIYAYAPYTTAGTVDAAPLSIPTAQDGVITDAMPMVSLPIALAEDMAAATNKPIGQASFLSLGAIVEYNIYTTNAAYSTEKVESVQFTSTSNIAGDFTVNLTTVAENAIPAPSGLNQKNVTSTLATATTVGDSKANGIKVYQVIAPGTWSGTITVTTDIATYQYTITDKVFTRGKFKPFNVDLASENATRTQFTIGERILIDTKWRLADYYESWADNHITDGYNVTNDVGRDDPRFAEPRLVFGTNHQFSMDNFHYYIDLNGTVDSAPINADGTWALSADNSTLTFSNGAFPIAVTAQYPNAVTWSVISFSASQFHIVTFNNEQWVNLVFVPDAEIFDHSFDTGDFELTDENRSAASLTDTFSEKEWTLANNVGIYKINTPWPWAGTVIWNGNGWDAELTDVTLSSSSFSGTIISVSIDFTIGQSWEITANCSVGGSTFGFINQHFTNSDGETPCQTATFTGSASGPIVITVSQAANSGVPIMLRGVHVVYIPD